MESESAPHQQRFFAHIERITTASHNWQKGEGYADQPGFCKSATLEEIALHDFVLMPGRYVGAGTDEVDDEQFDEKMKTLTSQSRGQMERARELDELIERSMQQLNYA